MSDGKKGPAKDKGELRHLGGSKSDVWNTQLANQIVNTVWTKYSTPEQRENQVNATVAALVGLNPKDEVEGMVAAQLLASHYAAMECFRRAMLAEQTFEGRRENLNQANKLSRTHAALVETLNRHRGKGQQKVTVEHVHVHAGGQAVVGNVEAGGGAAAKIEEQSHAQIAHGPEPALWCQDEERDAMPVACDDERSMQDARRQ